MTTQELDRQGRLEASKNDEGRYRLLIDAIIDYAIYMLDPSGVITSWNAGAQRLKGYTAKEIIGVHFSRFYIDEEREAGMPQLALDTAAREGRFEREGWRVRKDGTRFWANVVIDAIRSTSGDLVGFAKITRDLTEGRKVEERLRKSEEQFRLLVQGVTDYAIYMLDKEGYVSSWNAGAQRIKGYAPEEIIGKHFSRFYTQEEQEQRVPWIGLETARREGRWEREGVRVRKDGTTFWAHVIIDAIRNSDGELVGFTKITRDITERKLAQAELEKARETLFQSQKMEAIGQLTGGIAHDFNNLLMAALGSLELIRKRSHDPRLLPLIDNALQAINRGSMLTERMLTFARRKELKLEAVDVSKLLRGIHSFLQRAIGPTVRIDVRDPGKLPAVNTDPNQLETALLNLALNARDAISNGNGLVTITCRVAPCSESGAALPAAECVVVSVCDNGGGMNPTTLARATEPFFTTKDFGKGTGLGLSMVHGFATETGGTLKLKSCEGKGTTVELWLPIAKGLPAEADQTESPQQPSMQKVILLVDDEPLVLMNTAALLEDLGHHVITASSAAEALAATRAHPDLDLVITDYAMPNMDGLQLAQRMAAHLPDVPVIFATGYADAKLFEDKGTRVLKKPFTQEHLQNTIVSVVDEGARAQNV